MRVVRTFCHLRLTRSAEPKAAAKERQRKHGGTAPGCKKQSGKVSQSDGRVRDKIAGFAGISGTHPRKDQAIVEAAERQPRRFGRQGEDQVVMPHCDVRKDAENFCGTLLATFP